MNDRFQKNFFFSKDDLKKNNNEQRAIVEKKLIQAMKFSKKTQNQGIIRVIEDFAKDKGIAFDEQIRFRQYDILEKPLIFQPTVFITKDRDWLDVFEKFKSENLKIIPNQNLSEFKKIVNNKTLTKQQKLSQILNQRFTINDANCFPTRNPIVGNESKYGNIQFLIDDEQIPHRQYETLDGFVQRITVNWLQYINNVKKLREEAPVQEVRKMIKLQEDKMQMEQSVFETVDNNTVSLNTNSDIIQISQQQFQQSTLYQQIQEQSQENKQLIEELQQQSVMLRNIVDEEQLLNDLYEFLSFDIDQKEVQIQIPKVYNNEDHIRILPQFPKEAHQQRLQKLTKLKVLKDEIQKGYLYLIAEELSALDEQIRQFLQQIKYQERQIIIDNTSYTLNSPLYILGKPHPLNLTRQWRYFKIKDYVKFYIIHSQLIWFLYANYQIKSEYLLVRLNEVIVIRRGIFKQMGWTNQ